MNGDLGAGLSPGQPVIEGFDQVGGVDITGDVFGDIISIDDSQNSTYEITGDVHGHLIAYDGYHRDIRILADSSGNGGNLYGDVIATDGWITRLEVAGAIGTPANPVNIWSKYDLNYLECQDLHAHVDTTYNGGGAPTWELRVESTDPNLGNFTGSLHTLYFTKDSAPNSGGFVVTGDVSADIEVLQSFREDITIGGILNAAEPFIMGRNLRASRIRCPPATRARSRSPARSPTATTISSSPRQAGVTICVAPASRRATFL